MSNEVHKVSIINKNLSWESVSSKVSFKEDDISFFIIGHHGVPTDDGHPWIFFGDVLMAFLSVFDSLCDSFYFSVQEIAIFCLRKVIAVMVDRKSHFTLHVVK